MGILSRFADIMEANVNALLDKMEDPSKMIDQYLRNLMDDMAEVKKETAGVMAEEKRCKRLVDEKAKEIAEIHEYAKKALTAGNEEDAKTFLAKKVALESEKASLDAAYETAHSNATKMRQMHDHLAQQITDLQGRKNQLKATAAVAKTTEKLNKIGASSAKAQSSAAAFDRLEDKINSKLDAAMAEAELNAGPVDETAAVKEKYKTGAASVDAELEALKKEMGFADTQ